MEDYHKITKNKIFNYKYHGYLKDSLSNFESDSYLQNIPEIISHSEEDIKSYISKQNKNVDQTWRYITGKFFQTIVWLSIYPEAEKIGYIAHWEPKLDDIFNNAQEWRITQLGFNPDMDIAVYDPSDSSSPVYIYSCKTSLKDRVSQSAFWKMFFRLIENNCSDPECIINKKFKSKDSLREINYSLISLNSSNTFEGKKLTDTFDYCYVPQGSEMKKKNTFDISAIPEHIKSNII